MARDKLNQQNIDNSNPQNYPNGRIRNNDGSGNGTPVDESVYGDIHEFHAKAMRDSKTPFNGLPDNESNGYQFLDALLSLGGKNDLIKPITKLNNTTVSIPIKIDALKIDESLIFKSNFDSDNQLISIRGVDNVVKNLVISGAFKIDQKVRLINNQNNINLVGLYDSENVPNLPQTIANINNVFQNLTKILAVFVPGGTMMFWNKPANLIPPGWREVDNWKGRIPVGVDDSQPEFQSLGQTGGAKKSKILKANLPAEGIKLYPTKSTSGEWRTGSGSGRPVLNVLPSPFSNQYEYTEEKSTANMGDGAEFNLMNPYRTVLFIEYVG